MRMLIGRRRWKEKIKIVIERKIKIEVVEIMRKVIGKNRNEIEILKIEIVEMSKIIGKEKIRKKVKLGKEIGVVIWRIDIGLKMKVRIIWRENNELRINLDGMEIKRRDINKKKKLRIEDGNLIGMRKIRKGEDERKNERRGYE